MTDLFEEVEERLRSDRYKALALRVAPWIVALLAGGLLAALGVWGWREYESRATAKASEQYAQALDDYNRGRTDQAVTLWTEVAESRAEGYRSLALLQLGGVKLARRDAAGAVGLFDKAAEAAPNPIIGDVARLKSAFALLDSRPYEEVQARLTPLMAEGRPYRSEAREALAFAKLQAGDTAGAKAEFQIITRLLDAAQPARDRAEAAIALIESGSAKAVPAAVKSAAALPPAAPLSSATTAAPTQPPASGTQ